MENTEKTQPDATAIHDGADGANPDFPNARNQMQKETISNLIDDLKTETTALKQQVVALENKISTLREQ